MPTRTEQIPDAGNWCDDLGHGGQCKVVPGGQRHWSRRVQFRLQRQAQWNGRNQDKSQTVLFFETESGWNQHGGRELLLQQPRSAGVYVIGR
jgi:hypothetical protein